MRKRIPFPKGGAVNPRGSSKVKVPKGAIVTISTPVKKKKGGGIKMAKRPAKKNPWKSHGVATGAVVGGQKFNARIGRPGIDFTVEKGFAVRSKKVGPKKGRTVKI